MNKRKIVILASVGIVVIGLAVGILVLKSGKSNSTASTKSKNNVLSAGNIKYVLKLETKETADNSKNIRNDKEFNINDVKEETGKLTVTVKQDIDNADEAYKMATVLESSIKNLNKDKIDKNGIKTIQIVIKGSSKSWLYDNNNSIKEISIK